MSYYQLARYVGYQNIKNPNYRPPFGDGERKVGKVVGRPIDKREHYVKRCVGIAGDKFEVRNSDIYINDVLQAMPKKAQHYFLVKCSSRVFGEESNSSNGRISLTNSALLDKLDIEVEN